MIQVEFGCNIHCCNKFWIGSTWKE